MKDNYHIFIPILSGHNGNDLDFTTIKDNASSLIDYIDKKFGGCVLLIGGRSLGGKIKRTLADCQAKTLVLIEERERAIMKKSVQIIHLGEG